MPQILFVYTYFGSLPSLQGLGDSMVNVRKCIQLCVCERLLVLFSNALCSHLAGTKNYNIHKSVDLMLRFYRVLWYHS